MLPVSACFCIFESCFFHVAKAEAIVASEGHHMSIRINIDMNRMSRYLKVSMFKYAEDGSVEEVDPWELFPWPQYIEDNVTSIFFPAISTVTC